MARPGFNHLSLSVAGPLINPTQITRKIGLLQQRKSSLSRRRIWKW